MKRIRPLLQKLQVKYFDKVLDPKFLSKVKLLQDAMDDLSLQNFELENLKDEIMAEIANRDLEISQRTDGLTGTGWKNDKNEKYQREMISF